MRTFAWTLMVVGAIVTLPTLAASLLVLWLEAQLF